MLFLVAVDQRLGPRTADGSSVKEGLIEFRSKWDAFLDFFRSEEQIVQCCPDRRSRDVLRGRSLEIQCTDPVRPGLQKAGQLIQLCHVGIVPFDSQHSVQKDTPPPGVRRSIPGQKSSHAAISINVRVNINVCIFPGVRDLYGFHVSGRLRTGNTGRRSNG